ncbi:carbohydrate ABC transporter permease [Phytoactinopolyspora alkaliphila]|uniref:Carbohydrate ABC transporter permease n=2 Tax=Phytoactinopolyspora alkaliphila TaxID=1783498 RepID=A0A6N9YJY5_9ACTN|nr:carbohydrate ABC transporter permease [Phytoactinopolyspora alkaliphila]NED95371.1 carbohydrate ABC transporter permease [Phytoactinopolyspora alkaliphila]
MITAAVAFVFPVYILVNISLKNPSEISETPIGLPSTLYTDNYNRAWEAASLGQALINSTVITTLSLLLLVILGSMAAYGLVRGTRRINGILLMLFLLGIMIPLQLGMVPLYEFMRDLGLLQTYTSLIVFHTGTLLPVTIFLYSGFIRAQSASYEEAARMDGASSMQAFWKIVFPLLRPITGTVIIINAIHVWNDFLTPLLYLGGSQFQTLPVAIFAFQGEYATSWGLIFAGLVVAILPILIIYFLLQKYIIQGFASGVKG